MLSGSSWAGRRDRAYALVEHPQQRRLTEWKDDGIREDKRARRRAEFAARIPAMAADMASEISAAVASEVNAAVAAALDAMFARQCEAILDAVTTLDRARVPSATNPTSSSSDTHAPTVALASTSSSVQTALATPTTYSMQCPSGDVTVSVPALAPTTTSATSAKVSVGSGPNCYLFDPEPVAATSTSTMAVSFLSGGVVRGGDHDLTSSTVCSSSCPGSDTSVVAASLIVSEMLGEPLHKPDDADTAVMHEDEELMVWSSMEWPLTLVAASDMVDDHSFVTSTSAMPQTLAALSVDNGRVANKHKVLLPLKLLVPLIKSKELKVSPRLPQCTRDLVTWGTSLNQTHAKYSGTCSDIGYATTQSISLLPWDPGETTRVLGDSCLSRAWGARVKQLYADSSSINDHGLKPEQYMDCRVTCAPGYPAMCDEFLVGYFCDVQGNFHHLYPQAMAYWSLTSSSVSYQCTPITIGLVFPYGSISLPWKNAGSSLFVIWRANWSSCEFRQCILWSQIASLLILACGNAKLKEPMEQWDPGIARLVPICAQYCHIACLLISCPGSELMLITFVKNCPAIYQEKWFRFLRSSGAGSACICIGIVTDIFWPRFKLGKLSLLHCKDVSFWRYPSVEQMMLNTGLVIQRGLELIRWKIAWPLFSVCFTTSVNKYGIHLTEVRCGGTTSTLPLQFLAYVAMWSFHSLDFCQGKFSWDPGIWALLFFFGFFTPSKAKGRRNVLAASWYPIHCLDHACFFDKICECIPYLVSVILLSEELQLSWYPGGCNHGSCHYITQVCLQVAEFSCLRRLFLWEIAWLCCADSYRLFLWEIAWPMVLEYSHIDKKFRHLISTATFQSFTRAKATSRIKVEAPTFFCVRFLDHDYYFDNVYAQWRAQRFDYGYSK